MDDAKVGVKHFTQWHKIAIVTDQKVVEKFLNFFGYIVSGNSQGFHLSDLEEAKIGGRIN